MRLVCILIAATTLDMLMVGQQHRLNWLWITCSSAWSCHSWLLSSLWLCALVQAVLDVPKLHAAAEKLTRPAEWPALAPPNQAGGNDLADGFARILSAVGAPKESRTVAITKVMNLSVTGRVELALLYVYLCDIVSRGELVELAGLTQALGAKV